MRDRDTGAGAADAAEGTGETGAGTADPGAGLLGAAATEAGLPDAAAGAAETGAGAAQSGAGAADAGAGLPDAAAGTGETGAGTAQTGTGAEGADAGPSHTGTAQTGTGAADTAAADRALLDRIRAVPVLAGALPHFDPDTAPPAPGQLFARWMDQALADGVPEPQVVTVSTAAADGTPSARVLILRGIDTADCAFVFAGDLRSGKGRDLAVRPAAALTWYWPAQGRQIRMAGPVDVLGADATRQDFLGRSARARAAAFTGTVSAPLGAVEEYEREYRAAEARVAAEPERVPETHTVYRLRAREAEFFQADPARFHLRLRYTREGSGWDRTLLWP